MKLKKSAFVAIVATVVSSPAVGGVTARDYVQRGLICHLDGIDNVGTGKHDADATVWKDLSGMLGDFKVQTQSASFTGGQALEKTAPGWMAANPIRRKDVRTIEAVMSSFPGGNAWVLPVFISKRQHLSLNDGDATGKRTFYVDDVHYGVRTTDCPSQATFAATYLSEKEGDGVYQNGAKVEGEAYWKYWSDWGTETSIGGRPSESGAELSVTGYKVHAVRLYARKLSADEIAVNAALDRIRFFGASPSDVSLPEGWFFDGEGNLKSHLKLAETRARYSDGKALFDGVASPSAAGTVRLLWGYSADALENEIAVKTFTGEERDGTVLAEVAVEAKRTVYGKFVCDDEMAGAPYRSESPIMSVYADFIPQDVTTPVYEVVVQTGITKDLKDWMAEHEPAIPEISGEGTIVVSGGGVLTVTQATLAGFTGDVYIRKGTRVMTGVTNPLGTADGKVFVENGATLHIAWKDESTPAPFGAKPVCFEGRGTDGKGALWYEIKSSSSGKDAGAPTYRYLTGDGLESWNKNATVAGNIYLEGHTLGVAAPAEWDSWKPSIYDNTGRGHLNLEKEVMMQADLTFGSAINTITAKTNFRTSDWRPVYGTWTLIFNDNARIYPSGGTTVWKGPVYLKGRTPLYRQVEWAETDFTGVVSGPGSIGKYGDSGTGGWSCHHMKLRLSNCHNSYMGGTYLYNNVLTLAGNGSLPAAGGGLTNFLGSIVFEQTDDVYDLPESYFSGTGCVYGATGAFPKGAWRRQMVKTGDGELVYKALIGSPKLIVESGDVYFPISDSTADLPAFQDVQTRTGAYVRFGDGFAGIWAIDNLVSGGGEIRSAVRAGGFVVDASAAGESLTVTGPLAFSQDAVVEVPAELPHRGAHAYTLVTAPTIANLPKSANEKWHTEIVDNGNGTQSLRLVYGGGLILILK